MRCVNLINPEGDRCPNKALRGKCYCREHAPEDYVRTAEAVKKDAADITGENEGPTFMAMAMLAAVAEVGTDEETQAKYLGFPLDEVRVIAQRFKENSVWVDGKIGIDEDIDMDDSQQLGVAFILMAMCGSGKLVRV